MSAGPTNGIVPALCRMALVRRTALAVNGAYIQTVQQPTPGPALSDS